MNYHKPCCTRGVMLYQNMMDKDHKARVWNQGRLRELKKSHPSEVEVFCSHDVYEFERLAERSARTPVDHFIQNPFQPREGYRPYG